MRARKNDEEKVDGNIRRRKRTGGFRNPALRKTHRTHTSVNNSIEVEGRKKHYAASGPKLIKYLQEKLDLQPLFKLL